MSALLTVEGLRIRAGDTVLVDSVDLHVGHGESVGIVGESGSGKSLTCRAVLGITPLGLEVEAEKIDFEGTDLRALDESSWRRIRGTRISAVFQDPASYLNPSLTVGRQLAEVLRVKMGRSRRDARIESIALFDQLGLRDPHLVYGRHPHELSGGMLQRVLIAIAIAEGPDLLIADEPTTALDATVQAEVLDVIADLRRERGLALLFVSHDLAVVAQVCDRMLVMRHGRVVEHGPTSEVLAAPQHAYTKTLRDSHEEYGLDRLVREEVRGG